MKSDPYLLDRRLTIARDAGYGRKVLFLQGPISPYFRRLSFALEDVGFEVLRINLCFGDWLFWRRSCGHNYRGPQRSWRDYLRRVLAEENVTDLLLTGERRSYHAVAIEEANKLGISTVSIDFGYLRPDFITFEYDGLNGDSQFPRDKEAIKKLAASTPTIDLGPRFQDSFLAMAAYDVAYSLSNLILRPLYPHYHSHKPVSTMKIYAGTGWNLLTSKRTARKSDALVHEFNKRKQRYFVAALQMEGDFSITAYSPFRSVRESLMVMLESFAEHAPNDLHLIIRIHPLDPGVTPWLSVVRDFEERMKIAGRIHVTRGGSIDNLFESCLGLVTVNSTLGLRAVCSGVPVKTLGQAIYAVDGVVSSQKLEQFWHEPNGPDDALCKLFVNTLAAVTQIRGTLYGGPGLVHAIRESLYRLAANQVNIPLPVGDLNAPLPGTNPS
jgi:capsular polysaccharide export protein